MTDNYALLPKDTEKLLLRMIKLRKDAGNDDVTYQYAVRQEFKDDPIFKRRIQTLVRMGYVVDENSLDLTDTGFEYTYIQRQYGRYTFYTPAKVAAVVTLVTNLIIELLKPQLPAVWQALSLLLPK